MGSILDDIDVQIDNIDETIKRKINDFIKENYDFYIMDEKFIIHMILENTVSISDEPNADGKYEVSSICNVSFANNEIEHLTNGLFVWKKTKRFDCSQRKSLKSLEGAPEKVVGYFNCGYCDSLKSLEGAPKECSDFSCYHCKSLKSLKGAPEEIGKSFTCHGCDSLKSLEGAPKEVGGYFDCEKCGIQFIENDVKKVSNVKGKIYC